MDLSYQSIFLIYRLIFFQSIFRSALIGAIEIFEFKLKIGPCTDKLYAVLPAGVETNTPSETNFYNKI